MSTPASDTPSTDPRGRRALIDATVAAILEEGLGDVTLRSIARRASVSHAAPAHHFGDKAGLFTAVAIEGFAMLGGAMTDALVAERRGLPEQLQALGVAYVRFAVEHRAHFEVMFRVELLHADDPALREASVAAFTVLRETVREVCNQGFGPGWDVDELALTAWSMVHGLVQLASHGALGYLGFADGAVDLAERLTGQVNEALLGIGRHAPKPRAKS